MYCHSLISFVVSCSQCENTAAVCYNFYYICRKLVYKKTEEPMKFLNLEFAFLFKYILLIKDMRNTKQYMAFVTFTVVSCVCVHVVRSMPL